MVQAVPEEHARHIEQFQLMLRPGKLAGSFSSWSEGALASGGTTASLKLTRGGRWNRTMAGSGESKRNDEIEAAITSYARGGYDAPLIQRHRLNHPSIMS